MEVTVNNNGEIVNGQRQFASKNKGIADRNKELIKKYKATGDINIRNEIILANIRLVEKWAAKYRMTSELDMEDLVSWGVIGMIRAIDKFELSHNTEFSTYAVYWIRQSITRAIHNESNIIRLPVHIQEKMSRIKKYEEKRMVKDGEGKEYDIEEALEMDTKTYKSLVHTRNTVLNIDSLHRRIADTEDTEVMELTAIEDGKSVEDKVVEDGLQVEIERTLSLLGAREAEIIRLRYGLNGQEPQTLETVGKQFSITRERIRQIEASAIRRLKHPSMNKYLKHYVRE